MNKIILTEDEKRVIENLGDDLYTVEFIEHWINRDDVVQINAPAAIQAANAKGFLAAVRCIVRNTEVYKRKV